jgi:hypothetical protein
MNEPKAHYFQSRFIGIEKTIIKNNSIVVVPRRQGI